LDRTSPGAFQLGNGCILVGPEYGQLAVRDTNLHHDFLRLVITLPPIPTRLRGCGYGHLQVGLRRPSRCALIMAHGTIFLMAAHRAGRCGPTDRTARLAFMIVAGGIPAASPNQRTIGGHRFNSLSFRPVACPGAFPPSPIAALFGLTSPNILEPSNSIT